MKKFILLFSLFLMMSCGTFNRYNLTDETDDKNYLKEEILRLYENKEILSTTPLIVINGKPYRFDVELKEEVLPLSRNKIAQIEVLKIDVGIAIYGESGKNGVLVITTNNKTTSSSTKTNY